MFLKLEFLLELKLNLKTNANFSLNYINQLQRHYYNNSTDMNIIFIWFEFMIAEKIDKS